MIHVGIDVCRNAFCVSLELADTELARGARPPVGGRGEQLRSKLRGAKAPPQTQSHGAHRRADAARREIFLCWDPGSERNQGGLFGVPRSAGGAVRGAQPRGTA